MSNYRVTGIKNPGKPGSKEQCCVSRANYLYQVALTDHLLGRQSVYVIKNSQEEKSIKIDFINKKHR